MLDTTRERRPNFLDMETPILDVRHASHILMLLSEGVRDERLNPEDISAAIFWLAEQMERNAGVLQGIFEDVHASRGGA